MNIAPVPYYKETITLNTTDINDGTGTYEFYSSAPGFTNIYYQKKDLFNYQLNDVGGYWSNPTYGRYTPNTGNLYSSDMIIYTSERQYPHELYTFPLLKQHLQMIY